MIVDVAGVPLALGADGSAFAPDLGVLFVADVHLGKAATFRAAGVPVPEGVTADDLDRLGARLAATGARTLVVLGDLLHAAAAKAPAVVDAFAAFRARQPARFVLVRGNHDRRAGDPPRAMGFEVVDPPWRVGPFAAVHHPAAVPGAYALAGHTHPSARIGRGLRAARLPAFVFDADVGVLPAFGGFTGTAPPTGRAAGRRRFAVAGARVIALDSDGPLA